MAKPATLRMSGPILQGAVCPAVQMVLDLGALPGWNIAQSGLATGLGHLGAFHCLTDDLAGISTPHGVDGQVTFVTFLMVDDCDAGGFAARAALCLVAALPSVKHLAVVAL